MQTIQVQKDGDIYHCDIGISKDEWLEILKDESVADNYKEAVTCFYYLPNHKGSCVSAGKPFGKKPASLNTNVWQFGKFVQNRLNRFELVGTDEKNTYWPVVMGSGRVLKGDEEGSFEWQLRPELAEAVKDWLYWRLLEKYKKHRQIVAFDTADAYEVYKWQLITVCQGKTPIEIVKAHNANPTKPEKGGFHNLIYATNDNKVLKYVVDNYQTQFETVVNQLVDENVPLLERLTAYKTSMATLLEDTDFNNKANDERVAATILTCYNPQRYTFYKSEFYKKLCDYLGVNPKSAGEKYPHYLQLIEPLVHLIEKDQELESLVKNSAIANLLQSNLLLAQDVCWEMFVAFPEILNLIKNEQIMIQGLVARDSTKWMDDFSKDLAKHNYGIIWKNQLSFFNEVVPELNKILEQKGMFWLFNISNNITNCRFRIIDFATNNDYDSKKNDWKQKFEPCWFEDDFSAYVDENKAAKIVFLVDKFEWIKNGEQLNYDQFVPYKNKNATVQNAVAYIGIKTKSELDMETKLDKYINLLKTNHNLILTGAPGTGKTHLAKQIAEAMGCTENEIGFVQFHPSYDYTDFVEGLRPLNDDNGNVGFERKDGVFKEFCAKALENLNDSQKSLQTLQQESSLRDKIDDFIIDAIDNESRYKTEKRSTEFIITDINDNKVTINIPGNETQRRYLKKSDLILLLESGESFSKAKDVSDFFKRHIQEDSYLFALYNKIIDLKSTTKDESVSKISQKNFVFIIDEINRGEISKIFGELFFAIDPGYRGAEKCSELRTQYANLQESRNAFDEVLKIPDADNYGHFFVPENVYIIGTMNDIDRSVESMDFAFRRRFAFVEVKASENTGMLDGMEWKDDAIKRMNNLNAEIEKIDGLSSAYHIGASYFLKLKNYNGDFEQLWKYHLEGLLQEYLRGTQGVVENMKKLENAYKLSNAAADDSDSDN